MLLALESATARLSVALRMPDGRVFERTPERPGQHAEAILPLVDAVLAEAGCGPGDPTALAISIGPGSFTSLRVGLATVKGLAFATERKIVPVPTLAALAFGARRAGEEGPIAALLDARRGDLYAAVFAAARDEDEPGAFFEPLLPDGLFTPYELAGRLPEGCVVVGEGAPLFAGEIGASLPDGMRVRDDEATRWPRAARVAELAAARLSDTDVAGADDLAPRYVRRAEAEAKRTALEVEDA